MKYAVVTSMSAEGYEKYGKRFLESFRCFWHSITILLASEDMAEPPAEAPGLTFWKSLSHDDELNAFLKKAPPSKDYRFDAGKFAKKVFPLTEPIQFWADWLIWLDADTETFAPVTTDFLDTLCPDWALASYLGRKDWHTSECGFVAYNLNNGGREFLADFRGLYTSGDIYNHLEWHDSYLFDRLREKYEAEGHRFHNLSEGIPGMHVWDESPLGAVMRHHKGPLRQKGAKPGDAQVPDSYWSEKERSCATTA